MRIRRKRTGSDQQGFSLVELMIAMLFLSLLMAGMMRVFGASLNAFSSSREALDANRSKRWAIGQLADEFQMSGYFFPIRPMPGHISVDTAGGQNALMILPNQSVTYKTMDPATNTLVDETVRFDEIQFVTDQPLPIEAQIESITAATATLKLRSGSLADVKVGDTMLVFDSAFEAVRISKVSGNSVELATGEEVYQDPATGAITGVNAGFQSLSHQKGAQVLFVRPLQVVRFTILPLNRDPLDTTSMVPCLVKDQRAYPATGSRITWPAADASAADLVTAEVTRTVIAENVAGEPVIGTNTPLAVNNFAIRADISVDRGTTWERAATWPGIVTNLNARLATAPPPFTSVTSAANPIWYRNIPTLLRVDFSSRTVLRRQDAQNPALRTYRYRSQTLLITPRNHSLGA